MKSIICAACRKLLSYEEEDSNDIENIRALALAHKPNCTATAAEYEQAVIDIKFQHITQGLGL